MDEEKKYKNQFTLSGRVMETRKLSDHGEAVLEMREEGLLVRHEIWTNMPVLLDSITVGEHLTFKGFLERRSSYNGRTEDGKVRMVHFMTLTMKEHEPTERLLDIPEDMKDIIPENSAHDYEEKNSFQIRGTVARIDIKKEKRQTCTLWIDTEVPPRAGSRRTVTRVQLVCILRAGELARRAEVGDEVVAAGRISKSQSGLEFILLATDIFVKPQKREGDEDSSADSNEQKGRGLIPDAEQKDDLL